jgi:hypothetical protein
MASYPCRYQRCKHIHIFIHIRSILFQQARGSTLDLFPLLSKQGARTGSLPLICFPYLASKGLILVPYPRCVSLLPELWHQALSGRLLVVRVLRSLYTYVCMYLYACTKIKTKCDSGLYTYVCMYLYACTNIMA